MANNFWLKLYHEMLDDDKVMMLRPALRWRFVEALLVAGERGEDGLLPEPRKYAWRVRDSFEVVETELNELAEVGLLSREGGQWRVTKFAERQKGIKAKDRMAHMRQRRRKQEYYAGDTHDETDLLQDSYGPVTTRNTEQNREEQNDVGARDAPDTKTDRLHRHFVRVTGIEPPPESQRKAWGRWVVDLNTLLGLVGDDVERACALVDRVKAYMDAAEPEPLTYTRPGSMINIARRLITQPEREAGAGPRKREAEETFDWLVRQGMQIGRARYREWGVPADVHQALVAALGSDCVAKLTGQNPYQWQEDFVNVYAAV